MFLGLAGLAGIALHQATKDGNAPNQPPSSGATGTPAPGSPEFSPGGLSETVMTFPGNPNETVTVENDGLGPTEPESSSSNAGGGIGALGLGPDVAKPPDKPPASVPNAVFVGSGGGEAAPSSFGTAVFGTGAKNSRILDDVAIRKWGRITGSVW